MWESRVLRRAFERLELHEGKLSRAVLRGGGGGDVTSLPDHLGGQPPRSTRPFCLTHAGQATCDRWMPRPPLSARRAESWRRGGGVQRTHAIEIVTVYKERRHWPRTFIGDK